jgi:hypothetical protein
MIFSNKPHFASLILIPFLALPAARAQDPGPAPQTAPPVNGVEFQQKTVSAVVRRGGVQAQIQTFLKQEGMHQGVNHSPEGGDYYVAVGVASISGNRTASDWSISRSVAFDKAMGVAKEDLASTLAQDIQTRTQQTQAEGTAGIAMPGQSAGTAAKPLRLSDDLVLLTHSKLDSLLPSQGGGAAASQAVQRMMRSEEFLNFVRSSSQAMIAGMQCYQSFEDLPNGRNGEIGVIGIVSDKTLALAAAVGSGSPLPKGKPNIPIAQQIPSADTEDGALQLLYTFGVRTLYDENGDLVLVSFNQATPVNDSTDAELSAKRRAGTFAQGEIRKFLGEQIALADDVLRSESVKDYEDNTRATEAIEGGIHHFDALAGTIRISGIASVSDWVARHPVTGHIIVGSVQVWSPSGRDFAGMLRGKIAKAAAEAASDERSRPDRVGVGGRVPINSDQKGKASGQGLRGDRGGF